MSTEPKRSEQSTKRKTREENVDTADGNLPEKKVHPFFSKKQATDNTSTEPVTWKEHNSLLIGETDHTSGRAKIAAFDLDGTIITVKGKHVHAKNADDWRFLFEVIPDKLEELYQNGYKIVLFSNQGGLKPRNGKISPKRAMFMTKVQNIVRNLEVPIQIFVSTAYDHYRKPCGGMWEHLVKEANDNIEIDVESSLYVGDAAGRPAGWKQGVKKDFSDSDRKFAANLNLKFYTPEEYFLGEAAAPFSFGEFDPKVYPNDLPLFTPTTSPLVPQDKDKQEIVIFVGHPASGKTTFAKQYFVSEGYVHINQDTLHTRDKCINACEKAVANKSSVVIDNTNPDQATRAHYIKIAKQHNVPIRCFRFLANEALAMHNNMFRALSGVGEPRPVLPDLAFKTFTSRLQEPQVDEGFVEIKEIHFKPEFKDESALEKWKMWYR
ncbi:DNA kinase/phosphatase Pnk1 [Basidiobolus ranarum]|uniref:DNA kinase/phosphatase Pnk1 n=1 Tax=Basidiobolus ranarum TaxID=34480 RepID=A0ABR2WVY8_9FUNG